jgi:hypothetical protein
LRNRAQAEQEENSKSQCDAGSCHTIASVRAELYLDAGTSANRFWSQVPVYFEMFSFEIASAASSV